jgi:hypothetical protein
MQSRWIRVDRELPRAYVLVLGLVVDSNNQRTAQPVVWTRIEWRLEPSGKSVRGSGGRVTHWQPLPATSTSDDV